MSFVSSVGAWFKKFEGTYVGKVVTTGVVAFAGVFVTGFITIASNASVTHDWNAAWVALGSLVSGAFAAAIKAVVEYVKGKAPGL